ncbi:MAG: 4-(cytidine 5'-diphospho)-2-C-methyl-D-erythritol kinase [bacterium]|jgi:4-diphosphocytidyl-2-C-methyl-D-erythritol kinase|nr:4-(cytidine 5'-diphospho)-2-C-methyl-D-erythritol kinase [bacterium]MDD3804933.1 4-(cytidine 5'-diphospho)-2-C-methyl-D-erythritol kinase [bacterium]MDD4558394.1 4-(cytidine 5'-diphospho)-2-C-methyl-D-erythritol kinase [bacterium]
MLGKPLEKIPLKIRAYAKINLSLDILGLRPDGYHELRSLMQSVSLADELCLQTADHLSLRVDRSGLPVGEDNIILKCLRRLQQAAETTAGAKITLHKRIPIAAGLAGGSADGAAALVAAARLWKLDISQDKLSRIGAEVGSDIPFCLNGGAALVSGRGEVLEPLPPLDFYLLLLKPPVSVSTAWAYSAYDASGAATAGGTRRLLQYWSAGDLEGVARNLSNDLAPAVIAGYPEITAAIEVLLRAGALGAAMSGSGPTVFGIMANSEAARRGYEMLRKNYEVYPCRTVHQGVKLLKER